MTDDDALTVTGVLPVVAELPPSATPDEHATAVDRDLRHPRLTRDRVLALVVALLDETLIRIGTDRSAAAGGAVGLTTLACEHVDVHGAQIRFRFPGKSGQERDVTLTHPRLARQLLRCEEIPGQRLFGYLDGDASWHAAAEAPALAVPD
jgi:DNA topoisomerase I